MSKRILITGGFGYLGGRIAVSIAEEGLYTIRLASRKKQTAPEWLPGVETVSLDLSDPGSLTAALNGVDAVIHLAAMNENECLRDPASAILVNTLGTRNILQSSLKAGLERFIYFSTAHVYGAPLTGHITENIVPRPMHPYAITHRGAEDFVLAAHDERKLNGTVIRLSNGFGVPAHPGVDRWTLLVNDLCRQLAETKKIVLRSSGLQKRDFITLEDVGRGMRHLLKLSDSGCKDGLFNLGGQTGSMSIWEITQRVAICCKEVLNFYPEIIRPEPDRDELVNDLFFDSNKFKDTGFTWESDIDREIDKTLKMAIKYFR